MLRSHLGNDIGTVSALRPFKQSKQHAKEGLDNLLKNIYL